MRQTVLSDDEGRTVSPQSEFALSVVVAFQDRPARDWATQVCSEMNRIAGDDCVGCIWWKIRHLTDAAILWDAVQAAATADVVVVSLQAAEELPPELCAWIDAWLPRRQPDEGALVALIGVDEGSGLQAFRTRDYLRAVAQLGRLDFLPHEQRLPSTPFKMNPGQAGATTCAPRNIVGFGVDSYQHWGIND